MGLFDFFKKKPSPPQPEAPSTPAPLVLPFRATISSMTPDGVGTITLSDGQTMRFGASACQGFRPAMGLEVEVLALSPHPLGGERPSTMRMLSDQATYERLLNAAVAEHAAQTPRPPAQPPPPQRVADTGVGTVRPFPLPELSTPPPAGHRHVVKVRFSNKRDDLLFIRDVTWDGLLLRVHAFQAKRAAPETPTNVFQKHASRYDTPEEARRAFDAEVATQSRSFEARTHEVKTLPIATSEVRLASDEKLEKAFIDADEAKKGDAARVLADWLQSQGDVRGELAAVFQQRGEDAALQFLEGHEALLGEVAHALGGEVHSLVWSHGFVVGASLRRDGYDSRTELEALTRGFLASPLARFVTQLRFGLASYESDNDWTETLREVVESPRGPFIKKLEFDDYTSEDCEISWTPFGDFSPFWSKLPALEHLHIRSGAGGVLNDVQLPSLKTFIRESGGLAGDELRAILSAKWPKLERLDLWFGSEGYGAQGNVTMIQPLLDGQVHSGLKHLGLINCEFSNELVPALLQSKVLPKLEVLDLSRGVLMDSDVELMLQHPGKLAHLKRIDLSENLLNESGERLAAALPNVVVDEQRYDGDEDRYCAVGE
jgi:hypothetical protein